MNIALQNFELSVSIGIFNIYFSFFHWHSLLIFVLLYRSRILLYDVIMQYYIVLIGL